MLLHAPAARPAAEDVGVVEEAIEERADGGDIAEEFAPVLDRPVRAEQGADPLVAALDELEEVLGRGGRGARREEAAGGEREDEVADLTPASRSSRSTPLWPVLVAAPTGQAGVRRRPQSSGRRPPSRGEHPSPLQCAGATIPVAPARSPARVSRHSRRWPSRRRARSPPPTSTSRRPAPRWPVFRCRSMAGFG